VLVLHNGSVLRIQNQYCSIQRSCKEDPGEIREQKDRRGSINGTKLPGQNPDTDIERDDDHQGSNDVVREKEDWSPKRIQEKLPNENSPKHVAALCFHPNPSASDAHAYIKEGPNWTKQPTRRLPRWLI